MRIANNICARVVDHLNRELGGSDATHADLRHASGGRVKRADIDRIGRPAAQRHGAECAGGQDPAGLDEKFAAALALCQCLRISTSNDGILAIFLHAVSPCAIAVRARRPLVF